MTGLWWYKTRPGMASVSTATRFPASAGFELDKKAPFSLILFAHPKCDCSSASLHELQRILDGAGAKVSAKVVLSIPPGRDEAWAKSKLWEEASVAPGVTALFDHGGKMAFRFGARTSGEAFLYSQSGQLLFRGGLTESRGHIGESPGGRAIASIAEGRPEALSFTPTFGCALFTRSELKALESGSKKP